MTFALIGIALCVVAFATWEALRLARGRDASARRRSRMMRRSARQKAWDIVFGRRTQKRLSFDPAEHGED